MLLSSKLSTTIRATFARSFSGIPTAVHAQHLERGGKLVEFAGYALPVQYPTGVKAEHIFTRTSASLFDVSHMGQLTITGPDATKFIERITVVDMANLDIGQSSLSVITTPSGGIYDDTVITNWGTELVSLVVNGACKHKDLEHMQKVAADYNVTIENHDDKSLFALQGPKAALALSKLTNVDLSGLSFMHTLQGIDIDGCAVDVTRCGYTGEDGFELSVASSDAVAVYNSVLGCGEELVRPAGLGARDSLRLEAGLCLYGNDLNENTTPIEGTLLWTISKRRRSEGGFIGDDVILTQWKEKPKRKRIGLTIKGAPARAGVKLFTSDEKEVGEITSGTFSPTLGYPIAMGYLDRELTKSGTEVFAQVRKKLIPAVVTKMPFVKANYYKPN